MGRHGKEKREEGLRKKEGREIGDPYSRQDLKMTLEAPLGRTKLIIDKPEKYFY